MPLVSEPIRDTIQVSGKTTALRKYHVASEEVRVSGLALRVRY